jgi:hypothetical protein
VEVRPASLLSRSRRRGNPLATDISRTRHQTTDECRDRNGKLIRISAQAQRPENSYVIAESRPARRPMRKVSSKCHRNRTLIGTEGSSRRRASPRRKRPRTRAFINDSLTHSAPAWFVQRKSSGIPQRLPVEGCRPQLLVDPRQVQHAKGRRHGIWNDKIGVVCIEGKILRQKGFFRVIAERMPVE